MTDTPLPASQSVDTVVRAFTEAELALADVATSVSKFRSASEQLADATSASAAATGALGAATEASAAMTDRLGAVATSLGEAATALRAIDPERLWRHLESLEQQRAADHAATRRQWRQVLAVSAIGAAGGVVATVLLVLLATGKLAI